MMDKFEKAYAGLKAMERMCSSCANCPYNTEKYCESTLASDAIEIIGVLQKALKKKTNGVAKKDTKADKDNESKFIILTTGNVLKDKGDDGPTWHDSCKVAVKVDDILMICDAKAICGSEIRFKTAEYTVVRVQESIADILNMIAEGD